MPASPSCWTSSRRKVTPYTGSIPASRSVWPRATARPNGIWSTPSSVRWTRTTSWRRAGPVSIWTPTSPDPPAAGKDKGSPRAALCRFRFPTRSAHVEHFLMEMPVHIKALTGEVFAQGPTESGRAAEPDARLPPVGYGGAYVFAGQVAVAAADERRVGKECSCGGWAGDARRKGGEGTRA